jgi:hypothetical protein
MLLNHGSAAPPDFSGFLFKDYGNKPKAKNINKKERNLRETKTKERRNEGQRDNKRHGERKREKYERGKKN